MNSIKSLPAVLIGAALLIALVGCGIVDTLKTNNLEISNGTGRELPEWLTVAHRVQAVEELEPEPDPDLNDTEKRADTTIPARQPAAPQTVSTQPAQQAEQQAPATGTPRWQQQGTMEHIAKQRLDELAFHYEQLNSDIADLEGANDKDEVKLEALKKDRAERFETMSKIAGGIGLNLYKEYGIKPPAVETKETTTDATWFYDWDRKRAGF